VQCEGVHDAFPAVSIPDETPSVGGTLDRLQVPLYVRYERLLGEHQQLAAHRDQIRAEYRAALRQIAGLRDETTNLRSDYARLQSEYERLQAAQKRLRAQYDQVVASRSYRLSVTLGRLRDRTLGPVRAQGRSSRRSGSEDGTLRDGDT
jgi:hypothetical protein